MIPFTVYSVTWFFRIKCGITGHEMIAKEEIVKVHISGKKFQRLSKEWISLSEDEQANR